VSPGVVFDPGDRDGGGGHDVVILFFQGSMQGCPSPWCYRCQKLIFVTGTAGAAMGGR